MQQDPDRDIGTHDVALRGAQGDSRGQLTVTRAVTCEWTLELSAGGRHWHGGGTDLFAALRDLRGGLDRDGLVIGVNGARPECAVSGMLADMGEGRQVYVLTVPRISGRPEMIRTLGSAPLDEVSDVTTQDEHKHRRLA